MQLGIIVHSGWSWKDFWCKKDNDEDSNLVIIDCSRFDMYLSFHDPYIPTKEILPSIIIFSRSELPSPSHHIFIDNIPVELLKYSSNSNPRILRILNVIYVRSITVWPILQYFNLFERER